MSKYKRISLEDLAAASFANSHFEGHPEKDFLDRKKMEIVSIKEKRWENIANDKKIRFIEIPGYFDKELYVPRLIKDLNNEMVTKFFERAKDDHDLESRYNCFIDYNNIELDESQRVLSIIAEKLIPWCLENEIAFENDLEKRKPKEYLYDYDLSDYEWELPPYIKDKDNKK